MGRGALEVGNLRKPRPETVRVGKRPPLDSHYWDRGWHSVPFEVATATIWSINSSIKLFRGSSLGFAVFSMSLFERNVYSIRHLTDIYLHYLYITPYNSSVTRPKLVKTQPICLEWIYVLILWFIKLYKYTSYIKFTMNLISTNKYFHLPLSF